MMFLPPANEDCEGYVFTGVCPRGSAPLQSGIHTLWADTSTPSPAQCMLGYGQQAGGTHPTGMHSCSSIFLYCFPLFLFFLKRNSLLHCVNIKLQYIYILLLKYCTFLKCVHVPLLRQMTKNLFSFIQFGVWIFAFFISHSLDGSLSFTRSPAFIKY